MQDKGFEENSLWMSKNDLFQDLRLLHLHALRNWLYGMSQKKNINNTIVGFHMKIDDSCHLVFPWNVLDHKRNDVQKILKRGLEKIELDDETLRDGLQSSSVRVPETEEKLKILHYMNSLGIHIANIGIPAAGALIKSDAMRIAQEVVDCKMNIKVACAGRTMISDLVPIVEISQKVGIPIETHVFIGSSMIRRYVEDWDLDQMLKNTEESVAFCVENGLDVMYVTEDTTRADPDVLEKLYKTAIGCGAKRICLCDTVGYATPDGVVNLMNFIKNLVEDSREDVKIDWHGHNDKGLGLCNALVAAIDAGANRIHGTCLGIGERSGNVSIDQILINLSLMGLFNSDLKVLKQYCNYVSKVCEIPVSCNYPAMGKDAFRTATGVHAAAILKSLKKDDKNFLADYVYSAVPAHKFGLEQEIEIGPVSGKANVIFWLEKRGFEATPERIERIFNHVKRVNHVLSEEEIHMIVEQEEIKVGI